MKLPPGSRLGIASIPELPSPVPAFLAKGTIILSSLTYISFCLFLVLISKDSYNKYSVSTLFCSTAWDTSRVISVVYFSLLFSILLYEYMILYFFILWLIDLLFLSFLLLWIVMFNSMKLWAMLWMGPKTDGSWWRVLTKCGPLEKGMANHSSILASRIPWTIWKEYWSV